MLNAEKATTAVAEWRSQAVLVGKDYDSEMLGLGATGYFTSFFDSGGEFVSTFVLTARSSESGGLTHGGLGRRSNSPSLMEEQGSLDQGERPE
jgi:hypothetical protein